MVINTSNVEGMVVDVDDLGIGSKDATIGSTVNKRALGTLYHCIVLSDTDGVRSRLRFMHIRSVRRGLWIGSSGGLDPPL